MVQVFHKKITEKTLIYVWKITSLLNKLHSNKSLSTIELNQVSNIKSEKRQIEFLATRIALKNLFDDKLELKHHESGRPFIKEAKHISISHSNNYIAIAYGEDNIGIDIEKPQDKMLKLMTRILSKMEIKQFQQKPTLENACKMWSTKESVIKYIGNKNLNFKDDIIINKDSVKYFDLNFKMYFETIEEMILTYVIREA